MSPVSPISQDDIIDAEYTEVDSHATDYTSSYTDATHSANNRYATITSYDEARVFNTQRGVERQKNPYSQDSLADYKRRMMA